MMKSTYSDYQDSKVLLRTVTVEVYKKSYRRFYTAFPRSFTL